MDLQEQFENIEITVPAAIYVLDSLTSEERAEVFSHYCTHCGSANPRCQCWNDE